MKINCEQFETLMQFYFNDDLKPVIKTAFEEHLFDCKDCRKKYNAFKQIIQDLRDSYARFGTNDSSVALKNREEQSINTEISAYADNELDLNENIKLKKLIINKPSARKKFENIISLRELLRNSFEKTRPEEDFSKKIVQTMSSGKKINSRRDIVYALISFVSLSCIWIVMLAFAVGN